MGVRDPGFRVLTYEMNTTQRSASDLGVFRLALLADSGREDLYRHGGLFSITSKILVHDLLSA
jgi:DNA excision repair protein ERCC-4